jgi:hypothetical protein
MNNKKIAAGMSAVMNYIRTQEEMAGMQAVPEQTAAQVPVAAVSMNLWGVSGRQAQMQMRQLMQTKAFHGLKRR